ncbi:response regulator [Desulfuromonas sp. AOP6]|uniref:response regulator n=1 Tax=Desulfuromonas sp. AOP6 TaxID=1566351 RepID=UPI00128816E8|nr:response regulator [Desulfuromonas sp. AOP6]BCA79572.1 hybrid sensor histidine kinase/response regulator [Desulfuromonas sp. AOP6]
MPDQVLVVDDEKIILELTSMILKSKGFDVLTAGGGEEGLRLVEEHSPSVVLLDYMMPAMDGMTVLKRIRKNFPDTYVIMFTGKGSEEIAVELMKAGASDYVLKPFNNQDLIERIENVLKIRRVELLNKELRLERERLLREIEEWNLELEGRVAQKSRELEKAHAEIVQAEKLATLGHLSAGMAHEIRNPLNSISLFAQILRPVLAEDAEKASYIDKILKEVDRIDDILIKLLAASKRPRFELQNLSVADIIQRCLYSFQEQLISQDIEVRQDLQPSPPIQADSAELEQVFNNLFANAIYEMPQGGTLSISLNHDDTHLYIIVSDTGGGISPEHINMIFDPFFTTKKKGTGFGLSVVLRIVKTYNGHISVDTKEGQGSVFKIQLPLAQTSV